MTHFTKNNKMLPPTLASKMLVFNNVGICPSPKLKLLEVVLDQKLKYYEHIGIVVKRGIATVLTLKYLKNLRSGTARHLYNRTITLVSDYILVIWASNTS